MNRTSGVIGGSPAVLTDGFFLGKLQWRGWSTALGGFGNGAYIAGVVDGESETAGDLSDLPTKISFAVSADGSSNPLEKARLRSNGDFEFSGDVLPLTNGGSDLGNSSFKWDTTYTAVAKLMSGSSTNLIDGKSIGVYGYGSTDSMLVLTNDKDATKDSSVFVLKNGNVGIGIGPTSVKLYVKGLATSGYVFRANTASNSGCIFELPSGWVQMLNMNSNMYLNINGTGIGSSAILQLTAKGGTSGAIGMDSTSNSMTFCLNSTLAPQLALDLNNRIGFNTSYPMSHLTSLEVGISPDNGFTMTDLYVNKNRTTTAQLRDTSSTTDMFYSGTPVKRMKATNGDSLSIGVNTSNAFMQSTDGLTITMGGVSLANTVTATGMLSQAIDSTTSISGSVTLADAGEWVAPTGVAGYGYVMIGDNTEYAQFDFKVDGTVHLQFNSANVGTVNDVDNKLNIYDGGSGIVVENQLGATKSVMIRLFYMTPKA
jgi:hypothetical protein